MLELTDNATSVICSIAEGHEVPDFAGLRVTGGDECSAHLAAAAAGGPEEGDRIVEKEGARVFLDQHAAAILDDKILDAQVGDGGAVEFLLADQ